MSIRNKSVKAICIASSVAATALWTVRAHAYVTVGDFENGNTEGFFDWTESNGGAGNGDYNPGAEPVTYLPATTAGNGATYTINSEGATLGSSALQVSGPGSSTTGYYQGLSWKSEDETDSEGNQSIQDAARSKYFEVDVTYNTAEWSGANYANWSLIVNYANQFPGPTESGFINLALNGSPTYSGYPAYDTSQPPPSTSPGGWDPTSFPGTTTRTLIWDYGDYVPSGSSETLSQLINSATAGTAGYLEFILVSSSNVSGVVHFDNFRLSNSQVNANWTNQQGANSDGTYHWGSLANWNGTSLPSNPGDIVNFGNSIGAPETITLNGNEEFQVNVGDMNFNSGESYTIAQGTGGSLTFNGNTSSLNFTQTVGTSTLSATNAAAQINDQFGNHTISAPVSLATSVDIAVGQATNTLTISGNISGNGGIDLLSSTLALSTGTVLLSGTNTYKGGTTVNSGTLLIGTSASLPANSGVNVAGGTLKLAQGATGETISSLSISGNGVLDINNNHIIVTYGATDPMGTVYGYLKSGFNNGGWNGPGILSSQIAIANANSNSPQYGIGFSDGNDKINGHPIVSGLSSGQIELKYTLLGDANLDGTVSGADFSILAANFGQGFTNWDQGNFLFTPSVNGADFSALAHNFGQGDSGADTAISASDAAALDAFAQANGIAMPSFAVVPEPVSSGLLLISGAAMLTRRRKRE